MGKPTGFLEYPRETGPERPPRPDFPARGKVCFASRSPCRPPYANGLVALYCSISAVISS